MAERKFKLYDRAVIHDSFVAEHNDCVGEIFDFTCVNGEYYYHIKIEDGRLSLGTPEHMIKLTI